MNKFLSFVALLSLAVGSVGCKKDGTDTATLPSKFEASVDNDSLTPVSVNIKLDTENIEKYAYVLSPDTAPTDVAVMFATGVTGSVGAGGATVTIGDLSPETSYTAYFAGQVDADSYYGEIREVSFTTTAFTDEITIFNVTPNSYSVSVNLPREVAARVMSGESAIRSMTLDLMTYNMYASGTYGVLSDADILVSGGGQDKYFPDNVHHTASFVRVFDELHMQPTGEGWDDDWLEDLESSYYYYPIVPGQPSLILLGEFGYHEADDNDNWEGYMDYSPYFDYDAFFNDHGGFSPWSAAVPSSSFFDYSQDEYWSGYYKRLELFSSQPEKMNLKVDVQAELTPISAKFIFTPDEGIYRYLYSFVTREVYEEMILPYLNNDENLMQWYITSFNAFVNIGVYDGFYVTEADASDSVLFSAGDEIMLFVVAMGDAEGMVQSFAKYSFTIPESHKPAPKIEVTAIDNPYGENEPFEVWFNIKNIGSEPVYALMYAANYDSEWRKYLDWGRSYDDVVAGMGNWISDASEIRAVNSESGYNISFFSRDDARTVLAVKAMHDEGVFCDAVVADNKTPALKVDPVDSDLFGALDGEWTVTIPISYLKYSDKTFGYELASEVMTGKAVIGIPVCPETLTEDVYDLYASVGIDRARVDAYYKELKESVDIFALNTRGRNRILVNGFPGNLDSWSGRLAEDLVYQSPYDLFVSPTYNGATAEGMVWDFGPKWFLEVAADGTVSVPVNYMLNIPVTNGYSTWHMMVANDETGFAIANGLDTISVPVEISDDRNTITIKAYNDGGTDYWLSCGKSSGDGYLSYVAHSNGEIVLTRGWSGDESAAKNGAEAAKVESRSAEVPVSELHKPAARTPMPEPAVRGEKSAVKVKIADSESVRHNMERYLRRLYDIE